MKNTLILVFLFSLVSFIPNGQEINYNPRSLLKDIQKLWDMKNIQLYEIEIPDSMYNDILLDKGKIYGTTTDQALVGFIYVGRIYSCRSGGCGMGSGDDLASIDDEFEYFDYYIIFDASLTVKKIRVYNYQATHGHEVGGKGWLKQFIGYAGENKLEYGKNIDSISGATISANAITYNVQESYRYLSMLKPVLDQFKKDTFRAGANQ